MLNIYYKLEMKSFIEVIINGILFFIGFYFIEYDLFKIDWNC